MRYAQIGADGVAYAILDTDGEVAGERMIAIGDGEFPLGLKHSGGAWESVPETDAMKAARELAEVDASTGMSRTMREVMVAIAGEKAPAYLLAQEAKAAAARERLKK